jgi:hypothetical protein
MLQREFFGKICENSRAFCTRRLKSINKNKVNQVGNVVLKHQHLFKKYRLLFHIKHIYDTNFVRQSYYSILWYYIFAGCDLTCQFATFSNIYRRSFPRFAHFLFSRYTTVSVNCKLSLNYFY